ncbi:hypothetical protein D9757_005052 [Collybiopsis confluens]|uniref:Uncharacterized protein n=1 Tax=Collybiopsis confluens TaxID=2823264 RepID=A0A8H5HTJ8_9AGAR|nr:hypothetical protein D9757_005052 [Collybiopsis confluens]
MHWVLFCPVLLISLPVFPVTLSKAVNRSIDDTLGDSVTGQRPLFLPSTAGVWEDATCIECSLRPPIQDAYDQTYTAATYESGMGNISISFPFTGIAIYVFFILANNASIGPVTTAANFTLDAVFQGTYTHPLDPNAPAFQFNESALAFSKIGLENRTHNLFISTSGNEQIFVNFDYALYTFEEEDDVPTSSSLGTALSSASSLGTALSSASFLGTALSSASSVATTDAAKHASTTHTGAIIGGVVGGLVAFCAIIFGLFVQCYRQRSRQRQVQSIFDTVANSGKSDFLPMQQRIDPFQVSTERQNTTVGADAPDPLSRDMESPIYLLVHLPQTHRDVYTEFTSSPRGTSITDTPLRYQNRPIFSPLRSGKVFMSAGTNRGRDRDRPAVLLPPKTQVTSSSPSSYNPPTPLVVSGNPKAELRVIRQLELQRQMETIHEGIEVLQNEARSLHGGSEGGESGELAPSSQAEMVVPPRSSTLRRNRSITENVDVQQLKDQIRVMNEQIAVLQSQHNSAWALGLSDEPPPGYSPYR